MSCANVVWFEVESMTDLLEGGKAILSTIVLTGAPVTGPPRAQLLLPLQLTGTGMGTADGTTIVSAAVKPPWFIPPAAEVTADISDGNSDGLP